MKLRMLFVSVAMVLAATAGLAAEARQAATDPAEAGPDFAVQGEYLGKIRTAEGDAIDYGAQIVALGDGKFRGVGYPGGLPGAGWTGGEKHVVDGETRDGVTVFKTDDGRMGRLREGVITIINANGAEVGTLKKVHRESPTLGAKPPEGAVVLFDGTSVENFPGARMTDDGLLMEGATSKQRFQNFTIHLEFRTPFMPHARGQGRGNSGFYAQGRYEVQILDSFGLEGKHNECGGIYGIADPAVNMCFPPLSWQTFDVDFTAAEFKDGQKVKGARMTVRHNGVVIHDDVEIDRATTASPLQQGPESGPVFLQNHGNPVRFRNIWVVEKK
jgi:hypothetical protein